MNTAALRLNHFLMQRLAAGQHALEDRRCQLQLLVFNASLYMAIGFTLLASLVLACFSQWDLLLKLGLPTFLLFGFILYLARSHSFLVARVSYLFVCHLTLITGIIVYGKETGLPILFLHLALFPFLLFRVWEWRWIAICSTAAFVSYEIVGRDFFPTGLYPLTEGMAAVLEFIFSLCGFIGITLPSVLLLWQSDQNYRKALKRTRVQALDEKMAAIGRLAGGAAHEINNPLAIIRLTLENLETLAGKDDQRAVRMRIQKAYNAIHRIQSILQKLLVSTPQIMAPLEPLDVNSIMQLITQRSQHYLHNQGIQLKVKTEELDGQAVLYCQRQHVIDAVDSLIHNALEAMRGHAAPAVSLTLRVQNQFFQVEVADCGPGISKEMSRSIFTPFFTTKEVGSGLGLSLYSARCMARQYGGDLTCDNGPGGRFCLSLPLQKLT
ncbi:sensor histidine kinase [Oligoflexus tunisiensis]|uniref:sensor histidine kinase n=1 Tax=Oligoflexus tunisiensis TaxID=708132 RepID=UPI00114CBB86|nr:HAMP domain-containing sensor histidine kinase [Oligoflexus tunisiensis]